MAVSDSVTYFLCVMLALPLGASVTLKEQKSKSQLKCLKPVTCYLQL